jgi:hypothetical protein
MDSPHPMESPRCTAKSKQSGQRCKRPPIIGGTVCRMHGGAAPQVKQAALERLLAFQHPAIDRLMQLVNQTEYPSTSYQAVRDVLDRTMGKPAESVAVNHTGALKIIHEMGE